ncbi:MAG: TonB-dependent receptor family protein [Flavobacteriaceae bacterium]|nr:TonB-dependent receptor family protein [Flavobacteriaceae bacterium]
MKNFSLLFSCFAFIFSLQIHAQSVKLTGTVKDSVGNPLEMASIIAKVKETAAIESYAITNDAGKYQLFLPVNETYTLETGYLGFETQSFEVTVGEDRADIIRDITLKSAADELAGVEIVYEMPVTIKGDTIVYNTDAFVTGNEKKLGDIIKALPGLELNEDGEIEVDGKVVQKVMVEGKDFFDGDSKLATKNIPADAVSKVEVLRNYNEVGQLRGVTNTQDQVAINIRLKEGKTNFWFGEVTAGSGYGEEFRYLANPKLFYYSPDYSINIITNFNNTGDVPFTFRDYFNFTGGFRNFNQGGGTRFNINDSGLGFAVTQNNRANDIEAEFVAGNFSYKASEKLDISGFAILSDNRTNFVTNTVRSFVTTGEVENSSSVSDQRNQLGMLKLSSVYKPNLRFQLDYDVLAKLSKQTEFSNQLSSFGGIDNNIIEDKENNPFSINQNVNAYYTLNDKNIFASQMQHLWQDEDPFYNAVLDFLPFSGILDADENQSNFDINQDKRVKTNKLDAKVDHYYILNNKSNLNFTLGTTQSRQRFNSSIFQILDNGTNLNFDESPEIDGEIFPLGNDVTYHFSDIFLGAKYKFITGKFTFTPGVTLHNYDLKTEQLGSITSQNEWRVLPDFFAIAQLKRSESIRFNYAMTAEYTDVNNYAEGFVFNNYNRLFRGNRNLENSLANSFNLTYFSFNMFNYTNVTGSLNYTRRIEGIKNNTQIVAINQVSSPINIDSNFADETFSAFGSFSKRIKKMQYSLNGNFSWSSFNNIVNENVTNSESFTQNYRTSARSNFKEFPNFEVGYNLIINEYDNGGVSSQFFTHRPFANIEFNFLKDFTFKADWSYYDYSNKDNTIQNNYSFLSADLYYQKKDSKWEYRIQATNLLDVQTINQDSFNETFSTTSFYSVMPRIVMLTVKYDL